MNGQDWATRAKLWLDTYGAEGERALNAGIAEQQFQQAMGVLTDSVATAAGDSRTEGNGYQMARLWLGEDMTPVRKTGMSMRAGMIMQMLLHEVGRDYAPSPVAPPPPAAPAPENETMKALRKLAKIPDSLPLDVNVLFPGTTAPAPMPTPIAPAPVMQESTAPAQDAAIAFGQPVINFKPVAPGSPGMKLGELQIVGSGQLATTLTALDGVTIGASNLEFGPKFVAFPKPAFPPAAMGQFRANHSQMDSILRAMCGQSQFNEAAHTAIEQIRGQRLPYVVEKNDVADLPLRIVEMFPDLLKAMELVQKAAGSMDDGYWQRQIDALTGLRDQAQAVLGGTVQDDWWSLIDDSRAQGVHEGKVEMWDSLQGTAKASLEPPTR